MNSNTLIIVFNLFLLSSMVPLIIRNDYPAMAILAVLSLFSLVINKRLDDIEDLLRRYRGN